MSFCTIFVFLFVFFKQKSAFELRISDWSSDVCSSDLRRNGGDRTDQQQPRRRSGQPGRSEGRHDRAAATLSGRGGGGDRRPRTGRRRTIRRPRHSGRDAAARVSALSGPHRSRRVRAARTGEAGRRRSRSEERRGGKACASTGSTRWSPATEKKNKTRPK